MENKRQAAAAQVEPNQLAAMVEQLVATCDHYAARCTQESLLLEDRQEQLDQANELLQTQQAELAQMQDRLAQQEQAAVASGEPAGPGPGAEGAAVCPTENPD